MRDTVLQAWKSGLLQTLRSSARAFCVSTSPWRRYSSSDSSRGALGASLELCTLLPGGQHQLMPAWMGWDQQDPRAGQELSGQNPWGRTSSQDRIPWIETLRTEPQSRNSKLRPAPEARPPPRTRNLGQDQLLGQEPWGKTSY